MNHTTHPSNTRKLVAPADRLCGITCGKELTVQSEKTEIRVEKAGGGTEPLNGIRTTEATTDQLIELAGALEQRRGLAIVDAVAALSAGYQEGAFKAGFETACEEITLRLRTEVWDNCLPPVDAPKPAFHTRPLKSHDPCSTR